MKQLDDVFAALAHPLRRRILEETAADEIAAGPLAQRLGCSPALLSQHLRVLEAANLVTRRAHWRTHFVRAEPAQLKSVVGWAERQTAAWNRRLGTLKDLLEVECDD